MKSKLFSFLILSSFFIACKDDKAVGSGNFTEGAFVTCEGAFNGGTGTVTFINEELPEPLQDIFGAQNDGAAIGNILQSATIIDGKMYLVVNNANKVVVVDAKTFKFEAEITGFALPRYLIGVGGGKAFVSQWGADGLTGSVAVVQLSSFKIEKTIFGIGSGCERMIKSGGSVWVANSGGFGTDSTVVEIGISTESKLKTIQTGENPNSFATDGIGNVWVLSKGAYDWATMTGSNGRVGRLDFGLQALIYPDASMAFLHNGTEDLVRNTAGDLFFNDASFGEIKVIRNGGTAVEKFADGYFYDLAVSPTGEIWATDAKDFTQFGEVSVFKNDGTKRIGFNTGIIPGGVVFR